MIKAPASFHLELSNQFKIQLERAPLKIKIAFREALELFLENPFHPQLRNHSLKNEYSGYRSIDVTEDWRALFKARNNKNRTVITFHVLGTHQQLYG